MRNCFVYSIARPFTLHLVPRRSTHTFYSLPLSPSFYVISHLIPHLTIASTTFATASSKWCKVRCSRDGGDRQLRTRLSGAQGCGFDSSFSLSFSLPCQSFLIVSLYCIFLSSFLPVTFLLLLFLSLLLIFVFFLCLTSLARFWIVKHSFVIISRVCSLSIPA
jgi:hypothetical protein